MWKREAPFSCKENGPETFKVSGPRPTGDDR